MLEALIFDVDGTLAETERDGHRVAFNEAFREAGLDWEWSVDLYGELLRVTGGKERILHYVRTRHPDFRPPPGSSLEDYIARLHRAKNRHYARLLAAGAIRLRPGVARLLAEARVRGVRLAIATTTSPENVDVLLERTLGPEGPSWFEVIAAGDVVARKKPAPDVYEHVLARLGADPARCLAIEDSANGVAAARGAGVQVLVTPSFYTRRERFDGALLVVSHLGEPDLPFDVLAGEAWGARMVDLALAERLLRTQEGVTVAS